jgi:Tim17/Tim22/Tim23/Pmp24 family
MGANEYGLLASTAPPPVVVVSELGPIGKTIAGVVEIAMTVALEYFSGWASGYFLGTLVGVPAFVFRPVSSGELRVPFLQEMAGRAVRLHGRSFRWACDWGVLSCAFGGSKALVKVVRGGKQDEWNTVISSMMGGAILRRKEGPKAMVEGALLYGVFVYAMSFMAMKNSNLFSYNEEVLEF